MSNEVQVKWHVRWMIRRDLPRVLEIEKQSFEFPWMEDDFIRCLRRRSCIGMVAENEAGEAIGHMVYELHKHRLHLLNIAVHQDYRGRGVGYAMVDKLQGKLYIGGRNRILTEVRETNVPALLWLKRNGFKAISILRDFYDDTDDDAYLMQYRIYQ
jgi:[ribosomal protein S18]-alanine N-acetyltransferase